MNIASQGWKVSSFALAVIGFAFVSMAIMISTNSGNYVIGGGLIVLVAMVATIHILGSQKASEVDRGIQKAREAIDEQKRLDGIRASILDAAYDGLADAANKNTTANILHDGTAASSVSLIQVQLFSSSILLFMSDFTSSYILPNGVRGHSVLHFVVHMDGEVGKKLEINYGSYTKPSDFFSLEQLPEAIEIAVAYVESFTLYPRKKK